MLHDGAASNRCFMVSIVERALSVLDANAVHSPGAADVGLTPDHSLAVLASASRCVSAQAPAPPCAASIGQAGIDSKCLIDDEVMLASLERAAARSEIGGSPQANAQTTGPCRWNVGSGPVSSSHVIQALGPRSHASMEIERPAHPCVTPVCASSAPDVPPSVAALLEVLDPVWAAAEEDLLREVPMPTERPSVTVPVPAGFAGPPHLCPEDPAVCPVHPDGYCMYSCAVACENASEWLHTHDERGLGRTPEMRRRDLEAAQAVRRRMCSAALRKGDANVAARLSLDGPAGYPGLDDVPLLSNVLGGAVIVQCGDIQSLHGAGPLVAHLVSRTVLDGANHQTQHWDLLQSWYPRLHRVDVNVAPVTPHIVDTDSVEQQHTRAPDEPQVLAN